MPRLSSLGIGLSLVSGCLFLALVAELYYLFWWRKRARGDTHGRSKDLLHLFCWKKPSSLSSTALNPREMFTPVDLAAACSHGEHHLLKPFGGGSNRGEEDTLETELMRLHGLDGPPRLLFTIKEETKEDLEAEEGKSGGKSPFSTPLSSPPFFTPRLTPHKQNGRPDQFFVSQEEETGEEEFIRMLPSPPPKFKFLQDAEEKYLCRKKLTEEERKVPRTEEDGSLIAIVIGKSRDRGQQQLHSSTSQVIPLPLPSSPSSFRPTPDGS